MMRKLVFFGTSYGLLFISDIFKVPKDFSKDLFVLVCLELVLPLNGLLVFSGLEVGLKVPSQ